MVWVAKKDDGPLSICFSTDMDKIFIVSLYRMFSYSKSPRTDKIVRLADVIKVAPRACTDPDENGIDIRSLGDFHFINIRMVANSLDENNTAPVKVAVMQNGRVLPFFQNGTPSNGSGSYDPVNYGDAPPFGGNPSALVERILITAIQKEKR